MATTAPPRLNMALIADLDSPEQVERENREDRTRRQRLAQSTRQAARITARDLNTRYGFSR